MRAAIYARYSSDLQSEASIEDQVRLCERLVESRGWSLAGVYRDRSMSGASALRPGYQALQEDARNGAFEVVVAESLDRLSRDQEHVAGLFKRFSFLGIPLVTVSEGEISELHIGLKGTMGALYLKDLADKTRRGLEGRVRAGRSAGGRSFGYDVVREHDAAGEPVAGGRSINAAEAATVSRIFRDYAAGRSPRAIAHALNAAGVPGPAGRTWNPSTIHGNVSRGIGILNNELYVGRLVWNRQRFVKDPESGRRQARPNPPEDWIIQDVPALRIVDDALWQAVRDRQQDIAHRRADKDTSTNPLNRQHRPRYLLSGLLQCGACGAAYTIVGKDRYGCAGHRDRGTCNNGRTIGRQAIEARVLEGLKSALFTPDLVRTFVAEFQSEWNRLQAEADADWTASRRTLEQTKAKIEAVMSAIENGIRTPTTQERLLTLEAEQKRLKALTPPEPLPRLHPALAELYRAKVATLHEALDRKETRTEAAEALRGLIEAVRLTPESPDNDSDDGLVIELYGELGALLRFAQARDGAQNDERPAGFPAGRSLSMVAGAGFEPATFRL